MSLRNKGSFLDYSLWDSSFYTSGGTLSRASACGSLPRVSVGQLGGGSTWGEKIRACVRVSVKTGINS